MWVSICFCATAERSSSSGGSFHSSGLLRRYWLANRMPWSRFLVMNVLGGVAWASVIGGCSYLLGESIKLIAGPLSLLLLVSALGLMVFGAVYFRRHEQELEQRAARAFPAISNKNIGS